MKVEVTAEDIRRGVQRDSECCPVALALQRTFLSLLGGTVKCRVGRHISIFKDSGSTMGALPDDVARLVMKYDLYGYMAPFSFELELA